MHPDCIEADKIIEICPQISRTIGQNGAASLMQRTVADVCNYTSDLSVYETNKKILFEALKEYGYHCVEPGGTFYMFPRSLESDSQAFCKKAMEKDLMLVPGTFSAARDTSVSRTVYQRRGWRRHFRYFRN